MILQEDLDKRCSGAQEKAVAALMSLVGTRASEEKSEAVVDAFLAAAQVNSERDSGTY